MKCLGLVMRLGKANLMPGPPTNGTTSYILSQSVPRLVTGPISGLLTVYLAATDILSDPQPDTSEYTRKQEMLVDGWRQLQAKRKRKPGHVYESPYTKQQVSASCVGSA